MDRQFPFVSVLLPIRNEAATIQRCLEAVMAQDYPSDRMEVLVLDGMSTDATRGILQQWMTVQTKFPLYLVDNPAHMVPAALNIGIAKAKGDIIVRVDGHCEIAPDFISGCVKHLQAGHADGVGGVVETVGETWLSRSIAVAMSSSFGVGGSTFRTNQGKQRYIDSVPFPAYPKETIRRVGLYDEGMYCNEDDEYNYRLRALGMKLLLAGDIKSRYYCRASFISLWRQYFKYGLWKVRVLQKHPHQMTLRQFVPPAFVLALLASALLAISILLFPVTYHLSAISYSLSPSALLLSAIIPLLYIIVNLFACLYTGFKRGWEYLPLLPFIYAILHISYGSGFLFGLIKFAGRWRDRTGKVPTSEPEPV